MMAQKIKNSLFTLITLMALAFAGLPAVASALCASENSQNCGNNGSAASSDACNDTTNSSGTVNQGKVSQCLTANPIVNDINIVVNFLSAGVGIVVTAVIIVGGVQYTMAGDNPQAVTAAKQRIINGLIALLVFFLMFGFLQWIIPGGVFS